MCAYLTYKVLLHYLGSAKGDVSTIFNSNFD